MSTAIDLVEGTLRPCPDEVIKRELVRLKLKTSARGLSDDELTFQLAIYADELADYPQDVVIDALRYWSGNEKWWPAWAEIKSLLDERVKKRRALLDALRNAPREQTQPVDSPNESQAAETDPDVWFWQIMVPYIRRRLPDQRATALIAAWQCGDADAIRVVDALERERKLRRAATGEAAR